MNEIEKELRKRDPKWFENNPWSRNHSHQKNHLDVLNDEVRLAQYLKNKEQIEIEFAEHGYCGKEIKIIERNQ